MFDFSGKTVLVTGAGSGIGRSHALFFASCGASVIAHDLDFARLKATLDEIVQAGGTVVPFACDLLDVERLDVGIRALEQRSGPIDVLVNNAGIAGDGTLGEASIDLFDEVFSVNVAGTFFATRAVIGGMKQRRSGKIILTSSTWGMVGRAASSVYAGSKAALLGLTKAWAKEFAPWNIHVNCIAPGGIATELLVTSPERIAGIPLKRHGEPVEVAYLAAFLAAPASDFMTGTVISLNGGEVIVGC
jgi:3-oxoacyl-[acyl-carrier protein] reductase